MLVAIFLALAQDIVPERPSPFDETIAVELAARDGEGSSSDRGARVVRIAQFSGTLHAWIDVHGGETSLLMERKGAMVTEARGSPGRATPWVYANVAAGDELAIVITCTSGGAEHAAVLHLAAAPETEATRAVAAQAWQAIAQIWRKRGAGAFAEARADTEALLDGLVARSRDDPSAELSDAIWGACQHGDDLALFAPTARAMRRVAEHRLRTRPDDHPDLQWARGNLARMLGALGELAAARALEEKVLDVRTHTLEEDDPDLQRARGNLAVRLREQGELLAARALEERVLQSFSRTLSADHPDLQGARLNLANTEKRLGDVTAARALEEQALAVWSRTLAGDDPRLQLARLNLALTMKELGKLDVARTLEEQVLDAYSRTLPDDHPYVQVVRLDLAITLEALGDPSAALELEERVVETLARTLPDDHPDLARARIDLASTCGMLGDLSRARELYAQAADALARQMPDDEPTLVLARGALASALLELGDTPAFESAARAFAKAARTAVETGSLALTPREIEASVSTYGDMVAQALSHARGRGQVAPDPRLVRDAFALIEAVRAAGLTAARRLIAEPGGDPEIASLRERVRDLSAAVAERARVGEGRDALAEVVSDRDEAQRRLLERLRPQEHERPPHDEPDCERLAASVAPDAALVGYWADARRGGPDVEDHMVAFVVRRATDLAVLDLGPIRPIEEAATAWRAALGAGPGRGMSVSGDAVDESALHARGEALRRIVFDPLRAALGDARHVVVALDDVLHTIPLDVLPDGDRLLGERFELSVRLSLRELLWDAPTHGETGALVAIGGAEFDASPTTWSTGVDRTDSALAHRVAGEPVADSRTASRAAPSIDGTVGASAFAPLPATTREAHDVAELYQSTFGATAELCTGSEASRASLALLAPHARFLHLATHGWFAPDSMRSSADASPLDVKLGLYGGMTRAEQVTGASPMVLCGLALAGANRPADAMGRSAGLVTAEEIASYDLSGCELAVLSACDTNVGVRRAGQGVASLQRALQMAGARSVITSLWKVPDEATKDLMVDFYRRMWVEKKSKRAALWEAKLKLRDAKDERGAPKYATRDWAAWVLTGAPD